MLRPKGQRTLAIMLHMGAHMFPTYMWTCMIVLPCKLLYSLNPMYTCIINDRHISVFHAMEHLYMCRL